MSEFRMDVKAALIELMLKGKGPRSEAGIRREIRRRALVALHAAEREKRRLRRLVKIERKKAKRASEAEASKAREEEAP